MSYITYHIYLHNSNLKCFIWQFIFVKSCSHFYYSYFFCFVRVEFRGLIDAPVGSCLWSWYVSFLMLPMHLLPHSSWRSVDLTMYILKISLWFVKYNCTDCSIVYLYLQNKRHKQIYKNRIQIYHHGINHLIVVEKLKTENHCRGTMVTISSVLCFIVIALSA